MAQVVLCRIFGPLFCTILNSRLSSLHVSDTPADCIVDDCSEAFACGDRITVVELQVSTITTSIRLNETGMY